MGRGRYRPQDHWDEQDESSPYEETTTEEEFEEIEYDARPRKRHPTRQSQSYRKQAQGQRKRRIWPILLAGCGLGIFVTVLSAGIVVLLFIHNSNVTGPSGLPVIGNNKTFTHEDTQQISLPTISQIQVCDKVGNVTVNVDPNATTTTVTTKKTVNVANQSEADQAFKRIAVEVQPPGTINNTLACVRPAVTATPSTNNGTPTTTSGGNNALTVNVTFPNPDTGLTSLVDITITMPTSVLPNDGPKMLLNIEAPVGAITVEGISGLLNIQGGNGNVTVNHVILVNGSRLKTGQGNVTFSGRILPSPTEDTNYQIVTEKGNIDLTMTADPGVNVDLTTNAGTITSEFGIQVQPSTDAKGANYFGPLSTSASTSDGKKAILHVDVGGSGNIIIHKATT